MLTRVLFLTPNIPFAASIRAALERTGAFVVRPFSLPDAAIEYLRENSCNVAIVDFGVPGMRVDQVVEGLRSAAPQIAIIAIPRQHEEVMRVLRLQNSINMPFSARYIIPVLEKAVADIHNHPPTLPQTKPAIRPALPTSETISEETPVVRDESPAEWQSQASSQAGISQVDAAFQEILSSIDPTATPLQEKTGDFDQLVDSMRPARPQPPLPERQQQFVDLILKGAMDPLLDEIEQSRSPKKEDPSALRIRLSQRNFDKLAEEEPLPPTLEDSGTVSDLITGVNERGFRNVLSILRGEELEQTPPPSPSFPDMPSELPELSSAPAEDTGASSPILFDFDNIPPVPDSLPEEPPEVHPARRVLEETQDTSKWLNGFSLEDLIASIERQQSLHKPKIRPLPSWVKESKKQKEQKRDEGKRKQDLTQATQPPDTLPEMPPAAPSDAMSLSQQFADQPTRMSSAQPPVERAPEDLETMWETPSAPNVLHHSDDEAETPTPEMLFPDSLPEAIPDVSTPPIEPGSSFVLDADDEWTNFPPPAAPIVVDEDEYGEEDEYPFERYLPRFEEEDFNTEFERLSAFDFAAHRAIDGEQPVEDPYLAQLALSLTQVSLELTAEATLLTQESESGGALIAYAGRMADEDIDELRAMIADDWRVSNEEARIRFITLPSNGKDYMLYSRRTVDDLVLSLVFGGTTPLKDIRRQGRRLLEALKSIPDAGRAGVPIPMPIPPMPSALARTAPPDIGPYYGYACVWVLRDANSRLDETVVQAITSGMQTQLGEQFWRIEDIQARDEYVYVLADVPGEQPAFSIIRDLKRRSAEIVHKTNPDLPRDLWADGYLVVTPGRPLDEDEIQQFITFERMN